VGAGVLITPLLGFPHWVGVMLVGSIVITIVATAGMTSTTYVQFLKGGLLIFFALIIVIAVCFRGLTTTPDQGGSVPFYEYATLAAAEVGGTITPEDSAYGVVGTQEVIAASGAVTTFVKLEKDGTATWWKAETDETGVSLHETQELVTRADGTVWVNGAPESSDNRLRLVGNMSAIAGKTGEEADTGAIDPVRYLSKIGDPESTVNLWKTATFTDGADEVSVFYAVPTAGNRIVKPGLSLDLEGSPIQRIDFVSLMLALFLGTAALPHILIRYYTVPSQRAARRSTVVAIAGIGFFYVLTLFLGLGAMTSSTVNVLDNNMSAPLLAQSFGTLLFAIISAIAFATVLGTVSGLIIASSGAVAHDLLDRFGGVVKNERQKVIAGKMAAFTVGAVAIVLGIVFQGVNVSFLVGLAFAVAASANLPCIIMMLFWKRTTSKGMVASIIVGVVTSVSVILLSPTAWELYGLDPANAPIPLKNPGIISIPLSFIAIYLVSRLTKPDMLEEHAGTAKKSKTAVPEAAVEAAGAE
jgi:cation/acetate symporter